MSLPRALRMTSRREFENVRQGGGSFSGRWLMLAFLDDPTIPRFKAGFIVPKKLGGSVIRNRLRRRLREIVREAAPRLRSHVRIVTLARRGSTEVGFSILQNEWWRLAAKASLVTVPPVAVP